VGIGGSHALFKSSVMGLLAQVSAAAIPAQANRHEVLSDMWL
jgi:hypothetical protein